MISFNGVKILIVEDDPLLCEAICEVFASEGAIVDRAENGVVGLAKVCANNFDVILSDIKMPKGNGIEFMNKVNKLEGKTPLRFFLTGSFGGSPEELKDMGVQKVFLKPFSIQDVLTEIASYLDRRRLSA